MNDTKYGTMAKDFLWNSVVWFPILPIWEATGSIYSAATVHPLKLTHIHPGY